MLRAISLWQPWASLWCSPHKIHETRDWFTAYRGPLLVHAAKRKFTRREYEHMPRDLRRIVEGAYGYSWESTLPYGALIGTVELIRCMPAGDVFETFWFEGDESAPDDYWCGNFGPGRYAWRRGEFSLFKTPIPYIGQQGFFSVPDELVQEAA